MNSKLVRSFLGAMLCAMGGLLPVATWNMPELLVPCGVVGWLIGYHIEALKVGFLVARALITGANAGLDAKVRRIVDAVTRFAQALRRIVQSTFRVLGTAVGWVKSILVAVPATFKSFSISVAQAGVALFHWRPAPISHPMIRAERWRDGLFTVWSALAFSACLYFTSTHGNIAGQVRQYGNELHVIGTGEALFANVLMAFILFLVIFVVPYGISKEAGTEKRGYWNKYAAFERFGTAGFVGREFFLLLWIQLWWTALVSVCVVGTFSGAALVFLSMAMMAVVFCLLWTVSQAFYNFVRINKDYGFGSLAIGLAVGAGTFFLYREELVADPLFRLAASMLAGFLAGGVSLFVTWIAQARLDEPNAWFNRIRAWSLFEDDRLLDLIDRACSKTWKLARVLLPADTRLRHAT